MDFDNNEYVSIYLLPEAQVQFEVNGTFEFVKNNASTRTISFLNYLNTITQANHLVSALNTNVVFYIKGPEDNLISYPMPTGYCRPIINDSSEFECAYCDSLNPIDVSGFFPSVNYSNHLEHVNWFIPGPNSTLVKGFFGGCTSLEALLPSTLDCLYESECLDLLIDHFPALKQVCMT